MNKIAIIGIVVVLGIVLVGAMALSGNNSSDNNKDSDSSSSNSNPVGEFNYSYTEADYYQTDVYSVPTIPGSGNTFCKVTIKLHNIDSKNMSTSKSNFKFTADGVTYEVKKVIGNSGYFADDVDKGDTVVRTFYYEVPSGYSSVSLTWAGSGNVVYNPSL